MVEEYRELEREMCEKKLASNLPYVKKLFFGWFVPQRTKKQKAAFAPYIDSSPADKMAIIVMHKMMALLMTVQEDMSVRVVQAAVQIGVATEQEVRIHSFLEKTQMYQRKKIVAPTEESFRKDVEIRRKHVKSLIRRRKILEVQKLVKDEEIKPWGRDTRAKLGCRLVELLTETAYVQPPVNQLADSPPDIRPAFRHLFRISNDPGQKVVKRYGVIECDPLVLAELNLSEAIKSSSPRTVISHLPIHQDGSRNGLQHYAALGRDALEAAAVNLVAGEKSADVYSEIAARVHDIMVRDSNKDPATSPNALLAKLLIGQVDRKLVKQTVMTSVYGVTYVGAREQIKRRLEEKGQITDDGLLFNAACHAAKVTMSALGEIFEAARAIMGWLGDCAKIIVSENQPVHWTTPLRLPVVQPYFKTERHDKNFSSGVGFAA
ncbi:hypothetical protein LOK49_LG04G00656 [Camellia lanceoleosa]|uniref:Uncharacterized protein n=1 Tax=Camellia lanceoleosa TaxID=1840588 RepID=A0ACC0HWK8_9ERIC|nr:hypothetical protein LOK49_LG04G00656 [Camellia lanceoleosa]